MTGEQQLWAAVILNAIEDAKGNVRAGGSNPETLAHERTKARRWLTKPNRDFNTVCHLAGLDPMAVRERARRMFPADAPGVVANLPARLGTGGGPTTQDFPEIEFSQ